MSADPCVFLFLCPQIPVAVDACVFWSLCYWIPVSVHLCVSRSLSFYSCVHRSLCQYIFVSADPCVFLFLCPQIPVAVDACVFLAGIAQWLERRTRDRKVAGSNPCWGSGRIFFSRVNFLCWLLFRYLFHPRVTAVARKRPRSSCQKRRWQVTAKHAHTLRMWLCMKWHGAWLYGVHRMRRDWLSGSRFLWHQPC